MILQREITQLQLAKVQWDRAQRSIAQLRLHVRQAVMKTEKANCVQLDGQMYRMTPKVVHLGGSLV